MNISRIFKYILCGIRPQNVNTNNFSQSTDGVSIFIFLYNLLTIYIYIRLSFYIFTLSLRCYFTFFTLSLRCYFTFFTLSLRGHIIFMLAFTCPSFTIFIWEETSRVVDLTIRVTVANNISF